MAISNFPQNSALSPVSPGDRVFGFTQHLSLWFSLGVGLLVMQVGAYLVPAVGPRDALIAIVLGSVIGAGLLAWTAKLGCDSGLTSAGLMHSTYGSLFAKLPIILNIVQLVGWTTFELVIMRDGSAAIAKQSFGFDLSGLGGVVATTAIWGAVLCALIAASMLTTVRKLIGKFALPLVVLSLVWLTWQFGSQIAAKGFGAFWNNPGKGGMGLLSAMDLVIAMPVSWLPLIADYARHGKDGKSAMRGTWIGYALANIWCYSLGVMIVTVATPGTDLVTALLLAQGGLIALGFILFDEIDNAYGDVYSGAVNSNSLFAQWSIRQWGIAVAVFCTVLALFLPMHSIEPFLLMLSSVFVPLYGVILGRLALRTWQVQDTATPAGGKVDVSAAALWIAGIVMYHALAKWAPQLGSALPTLAVTLALAWATRPSAGQSNLSPLKAV
jgi:putative hydroxymethylpyrimidine transporter CytX